jgi:hypothetical protein
MTTTKSLIHSAKVREVQESFEHWRSSKKTRERIPSKLWRMAAGLCETYSVNRVARCLGLNYTALKTEVNRRLHRRHPKPGRSGDPAFVELTPGPVSSGILPKSSAVEYIVEAPDNRDGTPRIHVRGASVLEVAALVRALRSPNGRQPGAGS